METLDEGAWTAKLPDQPQDGADSVDLLRLAVDEGDLDAATAVLRDGWYELLSWHAERVRGILDRVDATKLESFPLIAMMLAFTYNAAGYRRVKAVMHFGTAIRAGRASRKNIEPIDRAFIHVGEGAAYRLLGFAGKGADACLAALRDLRSMPAAELAAVKQLPRLYTQTGMTLYYAGRLEQALDAFERGLAETPGTAPSPGFGSLAMLAGINALRGNLVEARGFVELARTGPWTDLQRSMYSGTFYRIAEALLALERLDADTAKIHLAAMTHDRRTIEHWATIAHMEALTELVAGSPGAGLAKLNEFVAMRSREAKKPGARSTLAPVRVMLNLAVGNIREADAILRQDWPPNVQRTIASARILLSRGEAGSALGELAGAAGKVDSSRSRADVAAIEAAALLRRPPSARSAQAVHVLGELLVHTGMLLPVALLPADDSARVIDALDAAGFGSLFAGRDTARLLPEVSNAHTLTERELAVLEALSRLASPAEIAAELFVSVNTVKTHLKNTYRKLGVRNRNDALSAASERNLLDLAHVAAKAKKPSQGDPTATGQRTID